MRRPRQDRDRIRRRGTAPRPHTRPSRTRVRRALRSRVQRAMPVPWTAILSTMCWGKLAAIDRPHICLIGPRSLIASGRNKFFVRASVAASNAGLDTDSADRVPPSSHRPQFGDGAHFFQHSAPNLEHIVWERRLGQVGTAFDRHGRRARGPRQRQQYRLQNEGRRSGTSTLPRRGDIERVSAGNWTASGTNVRLCESSSSPLTRARQTRATERTAVRCWAASPGLAQWARMLSMRMAFPVNADNVSAVLRIWPPPSPWLPSITRSCLGAPISC